MSLSKSIQVFAIFILTLAVAMAQYDLGEVRRGENRGDLTPAQIATIVIASIAVSVAFSVTVFFCYYVYKQNEKVEARYAYAGN